MNPTFSLVKRFRHAAVAATLAGVALVANAVTLADSPLFSSISVPGNLILALSVEWPTATTPAYPSTTAYAATSTFYGYFDPNKCYRYVYDSTTPSKSYFTPYGKASSHTCSSSSSVQLWSGNYMNWSSMQTLDAFRWVLTGGYRSVDLVNNTVLTKTYAAQNSGVMPERTLSSSSLAGATPFTSDNWTTGATTRVRFLGTRMWIAGTDTTFTSGSAQSDAKIVAYNGQNSYVKKNSSDYADPATTYEVYVNVKVCDTTVGVEDNCTSYTGGYKPEGLMQAYASKLRFSTFGYLNHNGDTSQQRDGGVMRARMKYIGPTKPVPGSAAVTNGATEWDSTTGIMVVNPDTADAKDTVSTAASAGWTVSVDNSGVMNYLNKFGYFSQSYKEKDPVSEMYYAALRYFKNLGNVSSYTRLSNAGSSATAQRWLDGFPMITSWDDPLLYTCQKNFVLGIGDVNTHRDANLNGSTIRSGLEPALPSEVTADTSVNVATATNMVGALEGISNLANYYGDSNGTTCANSGSQCHSYYVAGLAYDSHTKDIRSDLAGEQTVNTYWMDVLENQVFQHKNQYWLAAKYGGFDVPTGFSPYASGNGTGTLDESTWYTSTDTLAVGKIGLNYSTDVAGQNSSKGSDKRPDNYFPGNRPELMKDGLTKAFAKIAKESSATTTTAFSPLTRKTSSAGMANYSASYDPANWTGKVIASKLVANSDGTTTSTDIWDAQTILQDTKPSDRKIVTCCTSAGAALPFTSSALSGATLNTRTNYTSFASVPGVAATGQSAANFVSYLRGDTTKEVGSGGVYRKRSFLLGDIVDSKVEIVAAPSFPYFDKYNPGYSGFKGSYAKRDTIVYVGANDGMMHAFDGSLTSTTKGTERFAYIPSFTYGDNSATSDRYFGTYGLASLGNPSYSHHYFVNATPKQFDVDLANAAGSTSNNTNWRTLLIGGMGKGGKGYYAIDVTDPSTWTSESAVAGKVLWEFTDSRMGYTFGDAHVVKTAKYGWVVILPSGYNNSDGKGYIFIVNPGTGALLQAIATPSGDTSSPINLAHIRAFINDYDDYTADSVYAADLRGNLWRFDLTGSDTYAAPTKIATLTNASGDLLPTTTPPLLGVDPTTKKRYVMVGTGQQLSDSDINSTTLQAFYAIVDGTGDTGGFFTDKTLPSPYKFPISRSDLTAVTSFKSELGKEASAMGWYYDLSSGSTGIAERVNVEGDVALGLVGFSANLPDGDACSPGGSSRTFAVRFATGKSAFVDSGGNVSEYISSTDTTTDLLFTKDPDGSMSLTRGGVTKGTATVTTNKVDNAISKFKFLSWRELSTVD
ncbi:pilus assembly protein [Ideonella sp. YS5]|uniref:pilus assembly protein n=1 Tax=Ideonella sp. YS5 TaxID=3453714 RepID=UPI003EE84D75